MPLNTLLYRYSKTSLLRHLANSTNKNYERPYRYFINYNKGLYYNDW